MTLLLAYFWKRVMGSNWGGLCELGGRCCTVQVDVAPQTAVGPAFILAKGFCSHLGASPCQPCAALWACSSLDPATDSSSVASAGLAAH